MTSIVHIAPSELMTNLYATSPFLIPTLEKNFGQILPSDNVICARWSVNYSAQSQGTLFPGST